jgi:hypothetical protein
MRRENSDFGKVSDGLETLAMDRGAAEPGRPLTWRGSDLFSSEEDSAESPAAWGLSREQILCTAQRRNDRHLQQALRMAQS